MIDNEETNRPVQAFFTFATQEGFERAILYWPNDDLPFEISNLVVGNDFEGEDHKLLLEE